MYPAVAFLSDFALKRNEQRKSVAQTIPVSRCFDLSATHHQLKPPETWEMYGCQRSQILPVNVRCKCNLKINCKGEKSVFQPDIFHSALTHVHMFMFGEKQVITL